MPKEPHITPKELHVMPKEPNTQRIIHLKSPTLALSTQKSPTLCEKKNDLHTYFEEEAAHSNDDGVHATGICVHTKSPIIHTKSPTFCEKEPYLHTYFEEETAHSNDDGVHATSIRICACKRAL